MKRYLVCSAVLAFAGLSACANHNEASMDTSDTVNSATTLTAYHWTLGRAIDPKGGNDPQWIDDQGAPVTLTFDKQRLAISGLCNSMGASYVTDGPKITINQVVSTMKMCPDQSLMRYEQAIGQRLPQASVWHITHSQNDDEYRLTLRFNNNAQWVLTGTPTAETKYGSAGEIIFLEVAAQRVPCFDPLIADRQCLHVRTVEYDSAGIKQNHGPWNYFYDYIEGYEHTAGVRNILRVKRYVRQNPPADASSYAYILDMIVETDTKELS